MVAAVCETRLELMSDDQFLVQTISAYLGDAGPSSIEQIMPYVTWASKVRVETTLLSLHLAGEVRVVGWNEGEPRFSARDGKD